MRKRFLFFLCITVGTPTLAFAERFPTAESGLEVTWVKTRCKLGDQINDNAAAKARVDWAIRCDVLPKRAIYSLTMDDLDNGDRMPAAQVRYPTFAYYGAGDPIWVPDLANCYVPNNVRWLSVCSAGCYQADQMLRFSTGDVEVGDASATVRRDLITLSPTATLDDLRYQVGELDHYTMDTAPQTQTIVSIFAQSGGSLKVTTTHPVLRADGVIVAADTLRVGDRLVREDGSTDAITRIEQEDLYTQVYNVSPSALDRTSNIVIAQGYLNGSGRYQNEYVRYLNGIALRSSISAELLE